jgi:5-methyltetrahydrofolate--homocysteine methyltransferase
LDLIYDRRDSGGASGGTPVGTSGRRDPLQAFIELFPDEQAAAPAAKPAGAEAPLEARLQAHIIDGEKRGLADTLAEAMKKYPPLDVINDHLLEGMKVVGELFGSGQMQLPFVLQSAEVMKMAVGHLEPFMEKVQGQSKGVIVLATVKGDVHDIGKNLVDIILTNNGYTVHNLGIKQPIAAIIEKWRQVGADAIGLSGLLVKSVGVMRENLEELNAEGIRVPVILGGAALSRHYCEGDLRGVYSGRVYYGRDAFEGLRIMDLLRAGKEDVLNAEIEARLEKRAATEAKIGAAAGAAGAVAGPADAAPPSARPCRPGSASAPPEPATDPEQEVAMPLPPFYGTRVV